MKKSKNDRKGNGLRIKWNDSKKWKQKWKETILEKQFSMVCKIIFIQKLCFKVWNILLYKLVNDWKQGYKK